MRAGLGGGAQPSSTVGQGTGSSGAWHPLGAFSARDGQTDGTSSATEGWAEVQGEPAEQGGKSGWVLQGGTGTHRVCAGPRSLLTFCLAHVVRLHEVLGTAADVGALGVVAELGAGPKAQALVDIWAAGDRSQGGAPMQCPPCPPLWGLVWDPVSPHSPRLCPKDTISDAPDTPQARRHILLAKTNHKPNSLTPSPLQQQREVPWQEFLSGTFWKPLRHVQYVVDCD